MSDNSRQNQSRTGEHDDAKRHRPDDDGRRRHVQAQQSAKPVDVVDVVDVASLDSFPCSDPPSYNTSAA